eukprot:9070770-Pyramimonas_sp.AAC.1
MITLTGTKRRADWEHPATIQQLSNHWAIHCGWGRSGWDMFASGTSPATRTARASCCFKAEATQNGHIVDWHLLRTGGKKEYRGVGNDNLVMG